MFQRFNQDYPRATDLPRAANGQALLGDPRNDENRIVASLHAIVLRFHNQIAEGLARARAAARGLIDAAAGLGGSFFLTYHRWATRTQMLRCHPRMPEFLAAKRRYDPGEVFRSEWYRHMTALIAEPVLHAV